MDRSVSLTLALAAVLLPSLTSAQYYYPSTYRGQTPHGYYNYTSTPPAGNYWSNVRASPPSTYDYSYRTYTPAATVSTPYRDVPSSHQNAQAIASLSSEGIIHGISSGIFWPDKYITRAEAAKVFAVAFLPKAQIDACPRAGSAMFFDVPGNVWFTKYVCAVKAQGWMTGVSYGTFAPQERISLAEVGKVLSMAEHYSVRQQGEWPAGRSREGGGWPAGRSPGGGGWYTGYVQALADRHAIPNTLRSANEYLTRGEFAEILYRVRGGITGLPSLAYRDLIEAQYQGSNFTTAAAGSAIGLTVTADDREVRPGDTVVFTVHIQNRTGYSERLRLEAVHARDLEYVSSSERADRVDSTRIVWDRMSLRSGYDDDFTVRMRVRSSASSRDPLDFRVEARDDDSNTASSSEFIDVEGGSRHRFGSDLSVTIDQDRSSASIGEIVTEEIHIRNDTGRSQRVDVTASLDEDFIFISADRGAERRSHDVVWRDIRMNDGEEEVLVLRLRVSPNAGRGQDLRTDVSVEDDDGDRDSATDDVRVDDIFFDGSGRSNDFNGDLSMDVSADDTHPRPGDDVTFRIRIDNDTAARERLDVEAIVDNDLDVLSVGNGGREHGSVISWERLSLDDRDSVTLLLRARVARDARDGERLEVRVSVDDENGRQIERTETVEVRD